jgi:U3 small nucleolar RNA-associated protein 19
VKAVPRQALRPGKSRASTEVGKKVWRHRQQLGITTFNSSGPKEATPRSSNEIKGPDFIAPPTMPFLELDTAAGKKRKRPERDGEKRSKSKKTSKISADAEDSHEKHIFELEAQVLQSRKHYNNIVALLSIANNLDESDASLLARVALCRVYCRLLAGGNLEQGPGAPESERVIVQWLIARLDEYLALLLSESEMNATTLTLLMRLVREEANQQGSSVWENGIFPRVMHSLLTSGANTEALRGEYNLKYFQEYDDVRFHTLGYIM